MIEQNDKPLTDKERATFDQLAAPIEAWQREVIKPPVFVRPSEVADVEAVMHAEEQRAQLTLGQTALKDEL